MANQKKTFMSVLLNGLIWENPTFVLMLGMCPTLAITTSGMNGIGMGLAVTAVLIFSNLFISLLRNIIPDSVRIPAYIIIIASFVTMIDMLLKAFLPDLSQALGMFIPLIVVNCIIFARAESFASKNPPVLSIADGLGMGLGFTFAITLLSVIRELLGNGTFFGLQVMPASYQPMGIMTQVPGGFITLGLSVMVLLGDEGTLAAYGSVMHMLNHSLIKLTLFIAAGVVYMNLHALNLDDIRGFGRKKPLLHIAFLLGALSIACIPPLGSGYNSKSLLHEGLLELIGEMQAAGSAWMGYKAIEVLFLISGGLTVAYMAKLYICIFWQKHPTRQAEFDGMTHYMNGTTAFALLGSAAALPFLGALPGLLLTPFGAKSASFFGVPALKEAIAYFSAENLQGAAISIIIGAAVFRCIFNLRADKKAVQSAAAE